MMIIGCCGGSGPAKEYSFKEYLISAAINPFRYADYRYDEATGMYGLPSQLPLP